MSAEMDREERGRDNEEEKSHGRGRVNETERADRTTERDKQPMRER